MSDKFKLAVIGHARHGKDTVCELLRDRWGFTFTSSSLFCAEKVIFPAYKDWAKGEQTEQARLVRRSLQYDPMWLNAEECFRDRADFRAMWFDLISSYNTPDPATLASDILASYDVYAGIRSQREYLAARNQGLFDFAIWVDRSKHLPKEPSSSMELEPWMADFMIDNNGSLDDLVREVDRLMLHRLGNEPIVDLLDD
ncbi:MAG: hypothetical protein ACXWWG_00475 [Nitrospira sp.]